MKTIKNVRIIKYVTIIFFWLCSIETYASALDTKDIVARSGYSYGSSYNAENNNFISAAGCVEYLDSNGKVITDLKKVPTYKSGRGQSEAQIQNDVSSTQITDEMRLTLESKISVVSPNADASVSNKTSFAETVVETSFLSNILAKVVNRNPYELTTIANMRLKQEYRDLLDNPGGMAQFKSRCGDMFLWGIRTGREFYGYGSILSTAKQKTVTTDTDTTVKAARRGTSQLSADVSIGTAEKLDEMFTSGSMRMKVLTDNTSGKNITTFKELIKLYRDFNTSPGNASELEFQMANYNQLPNWPITDVLANASDRDRYLNDMITWLYCLHDLMRDADVVIKNPDYYALGFENATRKKFLANMKRERSSWQRDFDKNLTSIQRCSNDWQKHCVDLRHKLFKDLANLGEQFTELPKRYGSLCNESIFFNLAQGELANPFILQQWRGDNKYRAGTLLSTTRFDVAGSKLMALFEAGFREDHKDQTSHRNTVNQVVMDLNAAVSHASSPLTSSLAECVYLPGQPIKNMPLQSSSLVSVLSGVILNAEVPKYHIAYIRGNDYYPNNEKLRSSSSEKEFPHYGMLMNCGKKGYDLTCEIDVNQFELNLVSKLDLNLSGGIPKTFQKALQKSGGLSKAEIKRLNNLNATARKAKGAQKKETSIAVKKFLQEYEELRKRREERIEKEREETREALRKSGIKV